MAGKKFTPDPSDLSRVKRIHVSRRPTKVKLNQFARPINRSADFFFDALPEQLKAADLKRLITLIVKARKANKPFHLMLGAHVIKVGLTPLLNDLVKRKIVTGISFNSAGLIHDLELAFFGETSEDVEAGLKTGMFGMVIETAQLFNDVCQLAKEKNIGLGQAAGEYINKKKAPHREFSLLAQCYANQAPATIHAGIGTDTVAQHPEYDAAALAAASHIDFRILAKFCEQIDRGGVIVNIGSAVILPEVFLKALTIARNLSKHKSKLTTANFDMITHYRPTVNVINRPTKGAGEGFNFVGHHEIMIPLLAWGLKSKL